MSPNWAYLPTQVLLHNPVPSSAGYIGSLLKSIIPAVMWVNQRLIRLTEDPRIHMPLKGTGIYLWNEITRALA